jgi:alpha-L-fucosidase
VSLLGVDKKLKWAADGESIRVFVPVSVQTNNLLANAAAFKIEY